MSVCTENGMRELNVYLLLFSFFFFFLKNTAYKVLKNKKWFDLFFTLSNGKRSKGKMQKFYKAGNFIKCCL